MNADVNSKEGSYTAETIRYDDSQLQTILDDLDEIICLLGDVSLEINHIEYNDYKWEGESKEQYLELKVFMRRYKSDFKKSVQTLQSAVSNLQSLLNSISESHVIKEIDGA